MNLPLGYFRLLALILPYFLAHASPVFRKEECAKGSEVWCQNFKTASECGAIEHCQKTHWRKTSLKSVTCDACINLMTLIGNFMENGAEKPEEMCGYSGFCDRGKEVPLQAQGPARVVAAEVIPAVELVENLVQTKAGPTCELCQYVIKEIMKFLENNKTIEDVIHSAEKVCSVTPMAKECQDLVDTYGMSIIHLLLEETNPDLVCSILKICQDRRSDLEVNVAKLTSGVFCEVCKMTDDYLDQNLDKNSTKATILSAFDTACSLLPEPYKNQCDEFVKEYEPILIAALHDELDPSSLCVKIRACPKAPPQPLLGTEQCVWGPSYWCKNMETATQCKAVERCKRHIWN